MSMMSRTNKLFYILPRFLTWRAPGFRSICCGYSSQSEEVLPFREELDTGSAVFTLETGEISTLTNAAVVARVGGTEVFSTVVPSKDDALKDFLPLTVEYREKHFSHGFIPKSSARRQGPPTERELLCGRVIDRAIRPLFPKGFYNEVQVETSVDSFDGKHLPDVMAANAASAALMLSDIPWGGPIAAIRVGRISGQFVINPTLDELNMSDLNLVYACTKDKTLMIELQATRKILEKDVEAGLRLAHPEAVKYLEPQIRLAAKAGKQKREYKLSMVSDRVLEKVRELTEARIEAVFTDPSYGKAGRGEALDKITQDVRNTLQQEWEEDTSKVVSKAVDTVRKQVVRRRIITEGIRVDGRHLDEVRPLSCKASVLPMVHGSSLFSRGVTQVRCTVTLGSPDDAQNLESLLGRSKKRFMLHYSFPPSCINEVGKTGGLNRREVGHGALAEKALLAVLPPQDEFLYTILVNSDVKASDGSTSMAAVCGGSLALMDAGVPISEHVAAVSVGLISEVEPSTGIITDYRILTDILGLEDHLGDMDFKIAGTREGVTAIQLDIKPAGIPLDIICESLEPARKGRIQILDSMEREISEPRTKDAINSPILASLKYSNDAIRRLIGPLGALKRKIEEETGARMSVSDGTLTVFAKNQSIMEKAQEKIEFILGREIEKGGLYKGIVTSIKEYGAFVEFNGGQQGLLHISELSHNPVSRVSDVVSIGQQVSVMCIDQDVRGNIKLSLKATLPKPKLLEANTLSEKTPNSPASAGDFHERQEMCSGELPEKKHVVNEVDSSLSSLPSLLIRTPEECDEAEKSVGLVQKSKNTSKSSTKPKAERKSQSSLQKACSVQNSKRTSKSSTKPKAERKSQSVLQKGSGKDSMSSQIHTKDVKPKVERLTPENLKLGAKVTAKVYQIRARGLVLDLGRGLRGMYVFKKNGKDDFEIGDELQVECCSFSSKGIPVMSLSEDDD